MVASGTFLVWVQREFLDHTVFDCFSNSMSNLEVEPPTCQGTSSGNWSAASIGQIDTSSVWRRSVPVDQHEGSSLLLPGFRTPQSHTKSHLVLSKGMNLQDEVGVKCPSEPLPNWRREPRNLSDQHHVVVVVVVSSTNTVFNSGTFCLLNQQSALVAPAPWLPTVHCYTLDLRVLNRVLTHCRCGPMLRVYRHLPHGGPLVNNFGTLWVLWDI